MWLNQKYIINKKCAPVYITGFADDTAILYSEKTWTEVK